MPDVKHFDPSAVLGTVVRLFWRQGLAGTGMRDVVAATGVHRSSLYATFGGKRELYLAAFDRYLDEHALPGLARLAADRRGLPAIGAFFTRLTRSRCAGEQAGWGCLVVNAHTGPETGDPEVRQRLDRHHDTLRAALRHGLLVARDHDQLRSDVDIDRTAEMLTLLAYGMNVRSRAGARGAELTRTVTDVLTSLSTQKGSTTDG